MSTIRSGESLPALWRHCVVLFVWSLCSFVSRAVCPVVVEQSLMNVIGTRPPPSVILSGGIRVQSSASTLSVHGGVFDLTRPDADLDREIVTVRHEHIYMRVMCASG